jgi:hypothetical protein
MTARACPVCDKGGRHPFSSNRLLQDHMRLSHGRQLCELCLAQSHRFVLQLEPLSLQVGSL